jgi:hypothetical protein
MALVARIAALLLAVLALPVRAAAAPAPGPTPVASEYEVKAAFLYNFAKFVEWPSAKAGDSFVVAVIGADPFGDVLERTVSGKAVQGRKLATRRVTRPEELDGADIVFVSSSEGARLPQVLKRLEGLPILTVGDMDNFVGRGGMVGFRVHDDNVRFDIDLDQVGKSGLKMSSQLLRIARRVVSAGS